MIDSAAALVAEVVPSATKTDGRFIPLSTSTDAAVIDEL
jgi:hypothetical protein